MTRSLLRAFLGIAAVLWMAGCVQEDTHHKIIISTSDEAMALLEDGKCIAVFPVSTSKFGLGDRPGSCETPLGVLKIRKKYGDGEPAGTVFKCRQPTGEVVAVNAPGRDPIVTRILWLDGLQSQNADAFARDIYIHGTPEERNIGRPVSYGCIRMRSQDVIELYNIVGIGTRVIITTAPLSHGARRAQPAPEGSPEPTATPFATPRPAA